MKERVSYCPEIDKVLLFERSTQILYPVELVTHGDVGAKYFYQEIVVPEGRPFHHKVVAIWNVFHFDIYDEDKRFKRAEKYFSTTELAKDFELLPATWRHDPSINSSLIFRKYGDISLDVRYEYVRGEHYKPTRKLNAHT